MWELMADSALDAAKFYYSAEAQKKMRDKVFQFVVEFNRQKNVRKGN
jgi:hypothetical protein